MTDTPSRIPRMPAAPAASHLPLPYLSIHTSCLHPTPRRQEGFTALEAVREGFGPGLAALPVRQ
jgi:hypothetical protein